MEEIKEIIEICLLGDCTGCPLHDYSHCRDILFRDTLNVLNDLEKENKDLKKQIDRSGGGKTATERERNMKLEAITSLMYENEENQLICMQDINENVLYVGTVGDLRRNHPKSLNTDIITMYTERYGAYNNKSGLTVIIKNN